MRYNVYTPFHGLNVCTRNVFGPILKFTTTSNCRNRCLSLTAWPGGSLALAWFPPFNLGPALTQIATWPGLRDQFPSIQFAVLAFLSSAVHPLKGPAILSQRATDGLPRGKTTYFPPTPNSTTLHPLGKWLWIYVQTLGKEGHIFVFLYVRAWRFFISWHRQIRQHLGSTITICSSRPYAEKAPPPPGAGGG